ncbi:nitronate monooxygenase [Rudaeicoccus suwonensis]|uniref:Propionate 3-nitronate monooxygenase n=1 Tax=Rudaeicoccus suwonensis TaxID=657409 RepID=A0A561E9V2_9MICO|nr:nitronate monooxygenase [Rudaeicoccus suwonensis]TWE12389.1 nitroalkane oxidase [Rudaeicoccus suwonensis]
MSGGWDLSRQPVVGAPMAGAGTPQLAAAVSAAGGFGMLPAGYLSTAKLGENISRTRELTDRPFGVNIFVPAPSSRQRDEAEVRAYAHRLAPVAADLRTHIPEPRWNDTDEFDAKVDLLVGERLPMVSFVFGCPPQDVVERLHSVGTRVVTTVTDADEALAAVRGGADALCVQGCDAGGHRGTHTVAGIPNEHSLHHLLREVRSVTGVSLIAAGGIMDPHDVDLAIRLGAVAVQCGTAFLLTDEAGTTVAHRAGLTDPALDSLVVTRAFSGRPAQGLRNRFVDTFDEHAPSVFPIVDQLTKPLRAAAAAVEDHHWVSLWAGSGWRRARTGSASDVVRHLCP